MNSYIDKVSGFINTYYIDPILHDEGYNIINTLTWAIILGLCIFAVVKLLKKLDIRTDSRFIAAIVPFVLAGSSMRVLEDAGAIQQPFNLLLITPIIYFVVFLITLLCLIVAKMLSKKWTGNSTETIFASLGTLWFVFNIFLLLSIQKVALPMVLIYILGLGILVTSIVYITAKKTGFEILTDRLNISILGAHMLDASSTFIGVDMLGYYEKHVLPSYLIDLTGTALVMYPLKLAIFIPVLYILDTNFNEDEESRNLRTFVKLVILVLGLSPACRNTIRMVFGI
ncbi:putative membrane protein [Methanomethylovorans hollandica DSM 15978]|uniref:Putative membrane protein n=1 Tax=Methanomethylovorans hollandica (strain DSM 15978 / NBRC 107637 / DMS1) TaxID=867904 RepID=L0KXN3_METHD|nr:DUF63 family protein [Methanomethylovorans hollandica]AGB48813.1 putative membrane protein [Methanomethylovorans hollandica DSM 15978]